MAPPCDCLHQIVRFAKLRSELKPLEYCDSTGKPIDPDWLTITHNRLGKECHGGLEGHTLEYRKDDGSVITWEEFRTLDHAIRTAERWHGIGEKEWQFCMIKDRGDRETPWLSPTE